MPCVLVVDDQANVRDAVGVALRAGGYDAVGVDGAKSALREFDKRQYDVAIVDVYMPNVDGVKLIKALRGRSPRLPIIAMSGVPLKDSQHSALEYLPRLPGMSEILCLRKPFRLAALLAAVQAALAVEA